MRRQVEQARARAIAIATASRVVSSDPSARARGSCVSHRHRRSADGDCLRRHGAHEPALVSAPRPLNVERRVVPELLELALALAHLANATRCCVSVALA